MAHLNTNCTRCLRICMCEYIEYSIRFGSAGPGTNSDYETLVTREPFLGGLTKSVILATESMQRNGYPIMSDFRPALFSRICSCVNRCLHFNPREASSSRSQLSQTPRRRSYDNIHHVPEIVFLLF